METWMREYEKQLRAVLVKHPNLYAYSVASLDQVLPRMRAAFATKSYNKDGQAIRNTCRVFGIKHTYAAINAFIAAMP